MKTKVLSYAFFVIALVLGYVLYRSVAGPMEEKEKIEKAEKLVVQKLELIREAQKAHIKRHGVYADKWEKLISFVDNGEIYNIQLKENVIPRPDRPWLGDSIAIIPDTLEAIPAKEYILVELKKSSQANPTKTFEAKNLPYKIGTTEKFELYTSKIPMGGTEIEVIEVKDTNPVDKTRKESHDLASRRPLRFGSRDEVSTNGSWQ